MRKCRALTGQSVQDWLDGIHYKNTAQQKGESNEKMMGTKNAHGGQGW